MVYCKHPPSEYTNKRGQVWRVCYTSLTKFESERAGYSLHHVFHQVGVGGHVYILSSGVGTVPIHNPHIMLHISIAHRITYESCLEVTPSAYQLPTICGIPIG